MKAMKFLLPVFLITLSTSLLAKERRSAATGLEAGYGKVVKGDDSASGTSWVYHFEFDVDERLSFFGQAGQTAATKKGVILTQTGFSGGVGISILSNLDFRAGAAITDTHGEDALGALFAFAFKFPVGSFLTGPSVTYLRTEEVENVALRWALLVTF